ncbi:MAG: 50S ribosomal protein L16 [Candidatus Diapherotrites archaeon]|nr:50S ribosomal protein L16 [Candidatus Diapherotrites archaeon]
MALRPGRCYRSKKDRPYTRLAVTVHSRNYIGAAPGLKIRQFNMGNPVKDFNKILDLVVQEDVQIRDNALESARMLINRYLVRKLGKDGFFAKLRIYPYHVLRENKQAQGAHADRIQKGMSHAFGKAIGRAARVRPGQKIISILVDEQNVEVAKEALRRAKSKLNCKIKIRVGDDVKSIGTRPRKTKIELIEKKEEAAKETKETKTEAPQAAKEEAKKDTKAAKEEKKEEKKTEKAK